MTKKRPQLTREIKLPVHVRRGDAANTRTIAMEVPSSSIPAPPFQDLFIRHYAALRETSNGFGQRGIAVFADDGSGGLAGILCLAAKESGINTAIVGRHNCADLFLDGDRSLSLRHLALILHPLSSEGVVFRLLDLRTGLAFFDEQGRRLEALVSAGPALVRCGEYSLCFLETGAQDNWPEDAQEAWAKVPERVFLKETSPQTESWRRQWDQKRAEQAKQRTTLVLTITGPAPTRKRMVDEGEGPLGELTITTPEGENAIVLGQTAARQGVLIGRYSRCDSDGLRIPLDDTISRVHLLIIQIEDQLYAIDTASSNGTFLDDRKIKAEPLEFHTTLHLSEGHAEVSWKPIH